MMKHKAYLVVFPLFVSLCIGAAQEAQKATVQEPEYLGQPHYVDPISGVLNGLEKQRAVIKVGMNLIGDMKGKYELKGGKSPVRLSSNQKMEFVVRVASPQVDPNSVLQLVLLKAKSSKRELLAMKGGIFGDMTFNSHAGTIELNASRYGESSLKITPVQPLAPGEYALKAPDESGMGSAQSQIFYCFGVEASAGSVAKQKQ
jgi:hypothetical protein